MMREIAKVLEEVINNLNSEPAEKTPGTAGGHNVIEQRHITSGCLLHGQPLLLGLGF